METVARDKQDSTSGRLDSERESRGRRSLLSIWRCPPTSRALGQLPRGHSQEQEIANRGLLGAEQVLADPMDHILTRALGAEPNREIEAIAAEPLVVACVERGAPDIYRQSS